MNEHITFRLPIPWGHGPTAFKLQRKANVRRRPPVTEMEGPSQFGAKVGMLITKLCKNDEIEVNF